MQTRQCKWTAKEFSVNELDKTYLNRISPVINGVKYDIPEPTLSPKARQLRRIAFRNDQNFYYNKCMLSGKPLVSIYSPDKPFPVISQEEYWGDKWDPLEYGMDYDFSRSFFEQFAELRQKMPRIANFHTQSENASYTVHSSRNRNCYMCSSTIDCEDVLYSDFIFRSKDCLDCFACHEMEYAYQCCHCIGCYNSSHLELCYNLFDSAYCFDCRGGSNLVGCVMLRKGQNMILNQQATEEQCEETIKRLNTDSDFRKSFLVKYNQLKLSLPRPDFWKINAENSAGNYLKNTKNVSNAYMCEYSEDCRYVYESLSSKDCLDIMRVGDGEVLYECQGIIDLSFSAFCNLCYQCSNLLYCDNCQGGTENCFGSMSLKKHRYCILNKQYSELEYFEMLPRIISHMRSTGEWGEFFPVSLSPFGYNETKAYDWQAIQRESVEARGWNWSEYLSPEQKISAVSREGLPEAISEVDNSVLETAIYCEESKKPFKVVKKELEFYRRQGIPLPSMSPKVRHRERIVSHNKNKLYNRFCEKTGVEIRTVYSPNAPDMVYCEDAYTAELY